jgi:hypothetical protein
MKKGSAVRRVSVDHKRIDAILTLIWIMSVSDLALSLIGKWEEHSYTARRAWDKQTLFPSPPLPVSVVGQIT